MTLTWQVGAIAAGAIVPFALMAPGGVLADRRLGTRLARLETLPTRPRVPSNRSATRRPSRVQEGWLETRLDQAGWSVSATEWQRFAAMIAIATGLSVGAWLRSLPLGILAAAAVPAIGAAWLATRAARVRQEVLEGLPAALWTMAGSLKAGQGFLAAWQRAADEKQGAAARPWKDVLEETAWGLPVEESLEHFARAIRAPEVDLMVEAIAVQRAWGGNLAEILIGLHDTLRERSRLAAEVKALTAQGPGR